MRLYLAVARSSFRRFSTYRWATVTGVFVNSIFGVIRSFVLLAVWAHNPNIGGYDAFDAVTYCWLTQSLIMTTGIFGGGYNDELAERLRSGDIVVDLYRPTDLQAWWLASEIGRATFGFLARGVPPTIIGALLFHLRFPGSVWVWLLFLLAAFIGVVVGFAIRFVVALAAFWLVDSRGITFLVNAAGMFLSGFILPLTMFPDRLADVARALPWATMIQTPVDVFLGQLHGWALAESFGRAIGWAVVLLLLGRAILRVATRRLVVQGG